MNRITNYDLDCAVRRLNSIVHPHIVGKQPEWHGSEAGLADALIGSFRLRYINRTFVALHRVVLVGNVKQTDLVFHIRGKREAFDCITNFADGIQFALLHLPKHAASDERPSRPTYAEYLVSQRVVCSNTLRSAKVTSQGLETNDGEAVCEFCNRVGPGSSARMGEDTIHYCEACRANDALGASDRCPVTGDEYGTPA